jgi:hypothetical protein
MWPVFPSHEMEAGGKPMRLMPFPPTLVEALEWHEHLHLDSGVPLTTAFYERCDSRSEARVPSAHEASAVSSQPEQEWEKARPSLTSSGTIVPTVTPTERTVTGTHKHSPI